ncbi:MULTISPECIES: DUF5788 family protein [unclassified Haladaptatus]|uniref:DUF5788 family protein n=1 Tax=unclassified Haladaptatus TaxID=2622732 RepID=UPI0023E85ADC|nr:MULTISPECIES: DUF5788 family protein [unclassified Haladaptatus]
MKEFERKQRLERVEREGATVGADIPDRITVQGEPLDLRSFVFEIKRLDTIPDGKQAEVDEAKKNLRRERNERLARLEDGDITVEEADELVNTIIGIDRALNALEQLGPANLEQKMSVQQAADQKRWMNFLKQALGKEKSQGRGR